MSIRHLLLKVTGASHTFFPVWCRTTLKFRRSKLPPKLMSSSALERQENKLKVIDSAQRVLLKNSLSVAQPVWVLFLLNFPMGKDPDKPSVNLKCKSATWTTSIYHTILTSNIQERITLEWTKNWFHIKTRHRALFTFFSRREKENGLGQAN